MLFSRHTMATSLGLEALPTSMVSKETNLPASSDSTAANLENKQRRRMLVALALLLVALIVVLVKDHQVWLSSSSPPESTTEETVTSAGAASSQSVNSAPRQLTQSNLRTKKIKTKSHELPAVSETSDSQAADGPVITTTNRTVLPPLEVEVVAGNTHRALSPKNNSVKVDMGSDASSGLPVRTPSPPDHGNDSLVSEPSSRVTLPPATAERVSRSVKPDYPVLAKQMKVQGAVVLQALIDRAGAIQELHVVSGPAILANAAQEAVKQWHFKPYYQQGQAVETEARITVNFTISTY
jgi:TonB family protein